MTKKNKNPNVTPELGADKDGMQQGEIAEDKMEQNEDLAKLRAGVSLAKTGVQQAAVITEDN